MTPAGPGDKRGDILIKLMDGKLPSPWVQAWAKHTINERLLQKPSQLTQITLAVFCEEYRDMSSEMRFSIAEHNTCTPWIHCPKGDSGVHQEENSQILWRLLWLGKGWVNNGHCKRYNSSKKSNWTGKDFPSSMTLQEHLSRCPKLSLVEFQKLHLALGPWQREIHRKTKALRCVDWIKLDFLFIWLDFNFSCAKSGNTSKSCIFSQSAPSCLEFAFAWMQNPWQAQRTATTQSTEDAQLSSRTYTQLLIQKKERNQNCICHHLYQEQVR